MGLLSPALLAAQLETAWAPVLDRVGPSTPAQEKVARRQYQSAKALEHLIMTGKVQTPDDAMAQMLVAVGELRYAASVEGAEDVADAATDVVVSAMLALAGLLRVDLAALGGAIYLPSGSIPQPVAVAA